MKFQAPKGTRDFYPAEMAVRNWIMHRWVSIAHRHGFVEYDGPVFEYLDLYRVKSGDEIVGQLFHFQDRGGRELALRPEMTPTLARMVAVRANALPRPVKWFSAPRLCRAERPQRGRLREFFQWNIDIVGDDSPLADAECIFVAVDFFRHLGLSPDQVELRINSRAVVAALLRAAGIHDDGLPAVYTALDKRDKLPPDKFDELLAELDLTADQRDMLRAVGGARGREGWTEVKSRIADDENAIAECDRLQAVFDLLTAFGAADYCVYDMSVVRGLAYYTGVVFEGFGKGGLRRAVCGGGRYDRLLADMSGPSLGAVGFATSDVVVQDLLTEFDLLPPAFEPSCDVFVIDASAECLPRVLAVVGACRQAGGVAQFSYQRQGVGKQFKQAAARHARFVAIVESPDHDAPLSVKNMATGEQSECTVAQLIEFVGADAEGER